MTSDGKVNDVDLGAILTRLEKFCQECDNKDTDRCKESQCLVGFSKKTLRFSLQKGVLDIPGAHNLIPKNDFKPYYPEAVANALGETCTQCRECRDNHSDDCVISLVRNSLESTILQEEIEYPGSVFMYLAKIKEQNPELSVALAKTLQNK